MEKLLSTELLNYINQKRSPLLEEWKKIPDIQTELISDKIFDIIDLRGKQGSIKISQGKGEATYFNSRELPLCFIKYEDFLNSFRIHDENGKIINDWAKGISRTDYLVYDTSENKYYFIIHELSIGDISNKYKDGKLQLLNTVRLLCSLTEVNNVLQNDFKERLCFLSAKGCVKNTLNGMADSFLKIYKQLPDPIPIHNKSIENRNFKAYETNAIKI